MTEDDRRRAIELQAELMERFENIAPFPKPERERYHDIIIGGLVAFCFVILIITA